MRTRLLFAALLASLSGLAFSTTTVSASSEGALAAIPRDCDQVCTGANPDNVCTIPGTYRVIRCRDYEFTP